jgi:hypothetical protein
MPTHVEVGSRKAPTTTAISQYQDQRKREKMKLKKSKRVVLSAAIAAIALPAARAGAQVGFLSPNDIVVEQLNGDGGGQLNTDSVTLLEFNPANIAAGPVYTLNLPVSGLSWNGSAAGLTMPDTQSSGHDGQLTLSSDGHSLVFATYLAAVGYPINVGQVTLPNGTTVNPDDPSQAPRVITVAYPNGTLNDSTVLSGPLDYNGLAIRQVASLNGTQFWLTGNNAKPYGLVDQSGNPIDFGGLRYATLGATTSTSLNEKGGIDVRTNTLFQGQLYASGGSNNSPADEHTIYQIGSGIPSSGAQQFYPLPGNVTPSLVGQESINSAKGSNGVYDAVPYNSVNGNQSQVFVTLANGALLMYASDSTHNAIDKYVFSNGAYTLDGECSVPYGPENLVASVSGNTVTILLTDDSNNLDEVVDDGTQTFNKYAITTVLSAQGNAEFRGISFAPSTSPAVGNQIWASAAGASWNSASSWADGIPNAPGATATFGPASPGLAASGTVTISSATTVGHIVFNNSTANYTLAAGTGGSLIIDNSGVGATGVPDVYVTNGTHAISAPIRLVAGVSVDFQDGSSLTLSNAISGAGDITVNGQGTLDLAPGAKLPSTANLNINSAAVVLAPNSGAQALVSVAVAAGTSTTYTGTLDLGNNALVLSHQSLASVTSLIQAGLTDNGGIFSSLAGTTGVNRYAAVGVISDDDGTGHALYTTYEGLPAADADVIVAYTYVGDTTLKGYVNATDLANTLAGLYGGLTGWENGDFFYTGTVTTADVTALLASLQHQGAPFGGDNSGSGGAVPEPSATFPLFIGGLVAASRRRRSSIASEAST